METEMNEPFCDAEPYRSFKACFNCRFKNDGEDCPIAAEKNGSAKVFDHPNCSWIKYTASGARDDVRLEHSCLLHQYAAHPGDKPVCDRVKGFCHVPASCEACAAEWGGMEVPPCGWDSC